MTINILHNAASDLLSPCITWEFLVRSCNCPFSMILYRYYSTLL